VKELKEEFNRGEMVAGLPKEVTGRITDEILQRLRSLNANANISEQRGRFIFQFCVVSLYNCLCYDRLVNAIRIGMDTWFVGFLNAQLILSILLIKEQLIWYNAWEA
jgi:hypothetical protein